MTSFVLDSATDQPKFLSGTQTGLVNEFGSIHSSNGAAVHMRGSSSLTVLGDVSNDGPAAALVSAGSVNLSVEVSVSGQMLGGTGRAIDVTFSTGFILHNAGSIDGRVVLDGGGLSSVVEVVNSGSVSWFDPGNGTAGFTLTTARLDLINSGTFSSIASDDGADRVENTGATGALSLAGGADLLINRVGGEVHGAVDMGAGNDKIVNQGNVLSSTSGGIKMGDGRDLFLGLTGSADTVYGGKGNDILRNGPDGDLYGGNGNDVLVAGETSTSGQPQANLFGGNGNDTLSIGLVGEMTGGTGADTFAWAVDVTGGETIGATYVMDFEDALDRLDLSAFGFVDVADALAHFTQNGGNGLLFRFDRLIDIFTVTDVMFVESATPITVTDLADNLIL